MADKAKKADRPLLERQKNDVFRFVMSRGFDPGDFRWQLAISPATPPATVDQLVHTASEYFFVFDLAPRQWETDPDRASYFSPRS